MIGIGKVYKNLMVDVQQTNEKLIVRAQNITMEATGCDREEAKKVLEEADGSVKTAIVMILKNCSKEVALSSLEAANGRVREAIN